MIGIVKFASLLNMFLQQGKVQEMKGKLRKMKKGPNLVMFMITIGTTVKRILNIQIEA